MGESIPNGWGSDSLSALLDVARDNQFAAFQCHAHDYALVAEVDAVFMAATAAMPYTADWFPGLLLLSAHRAFRAGVHLALAGFAPESYACGRLVLEYSLASLHLAKHPSSQVVWMSRQDGDAAKGKVRGEFSYGRLLSELRSFQSDKADKLSTLYERTIDRGAHPNEYALTQVLEVESESDQKKFKVAHLCGDGPVLASAMKTLAQCGVCSLDVFETVYPERFALTGVVDAMKGLKSKL